MVVQVLNHCFLHLLMLRSDCKAINVDWDRNYDSTTTPITPIWATGGWGGTPGSSWPGHSIHTCIVEEKIYKLELGVNFIKLFFYFATFYSKY